MPTRSVKALLSIIENVLDYSKIEAGKMRIEKRPFDYRKIVKETIDVLSATAQAKKLAFSAHIDDAVPETIIGKTQAHGKAILDTVDLLHTLDDNQELLNEILKRFLIDVGGLIASMKQRLRNNNLGEAKRIAHAIKGASLNIGAQEMADLTIAFESACKNNTMQPQKIMEKLGQSFLSVKQAIKNQLTGM
jgi:HPt (histidine-containing phosphotransfer) domain-containing protein